MTSAVSTALVAPTILKALGLNPNDLDGVHIEGPPKLPGLPFSSQNDEDDQ